MKTGLGNAMKGLVLTALAVCGTASASHITLDDFLTDTSNAIFMGFCVNDTGGLPNSTQADLDTLDIVLAISLSADQSTVYFEFVNRSSSSSSVAEIYFDEGGAKVRGSYVDAATRVIENGTVFGTLEANPGDVDFAIGSVNPGNLPSGNDLDPVFTANPALSAGLTGNNSTGLNAGENLILAYDLLISPTDFLAAVTPPLDNEFGADFRVGLHIRSIGAGGQSDAFIGKPMSTPPDPTPSTPVPEPATMVLLGMGTAFLAVRRRSFSA